ncbi:NepR family anti-sigma factor [Pseudooctadecabacter jejudonensis]|uniref:Anti-sigma factor NepR domain-containing protein n=1 Tax=Pseudooctadecabacter jejudonensis TaxID=1391910 RepID=A0A1Y5T887_9RHOB|nr:NepR family anti-sigma factor [Pseudooctadecabacter jejudonensis]SLN58049.1 hypothetical protein PSJ8397_03033 [Pseudooctadecabacter jejudonensis]
MAHNDDTANGEDDAINANLKRVYDDVLNQEIPDRFKDLLAQLKQQEPSDGGNTGEAK